MNRVPVFATAERVLRQLRHDLRTVTLLLGVPAVLMTLLRYVFEARPLVFDRVGPQLLALFPFTTMFVVASVAMLRERTSGTLERLLSMPIAKLDLLVGYALAFAALALAQVTVAATLTLGPLQMRTTGDPAMIALFAELDALLGMALGLFLSAFARSEFQAVQFLPAFVLPQFLLCGLFTPRSELPSVLRWASDAFPLSYAVDGVSRVAQSPGLGHAVAIDAAVIGGCFVVALAGGAATLRRQTG